MKKKPALPFPRRHPNSLEQTVSSAVQVLTMLQQLVDVVEDYERMQQALAHAIAMDERSKAQLKVADRQVEELSVKVTQLQRRVEQKDQRELRVQHAIQPYKTALALLVTPTDAVLEAALGAWLVDTSSPIAAMRRALNAAACEAAGLEMIGEMGL